MPPFRNWTNLAQVIQHAESLTKATHLRHVVYCLNGRSHYAIAEFGKMPNDFTRIGNLIVDRGFQQRFSIMYITKV